MHEASADRRYLDAVTRAVTRLSGQFQDHPESWAASVATLNRHRLPSGTAGATAANSPPAPDATDGIHVPVTADHVGATASARSVPDEDEVLVTIKVDDKFHINANPASFDFLIPTTVEFKGIKPNKVEYPKSTRFTAEFAREGLDVYEGSVAIVARFRKGSLSANSSIEGAVTAQACTNKICLPPSTLPISAATTGGK